MRFILVNGRTPRPQSFCVMCDQPIERSYLREIGTHLIYCDHDCYADHCESAFLLLENRARASRTFSPTGKKVSPTINPSAVAETSRSRRKGHCDESL